MKKTKHIFSLIICLSMLLETVGFSLPGLSAGESLLASAAEGNYYRINGKYVNCNSADGASNNEYTKALFSFIWDEEYTNDFVGSDNILKNYSTVDRALTPDHLCEYVSMCVPGAVIRVETPVNDENKTKYGSEFIIASRDANGFFAFEKTNARKETYYTWLSFCDRYNYSVIRFIKWPGSFFATADIVNETDFVKPDRALYYDYDYLLSGDDVRWVQQKLMDAGFEVSVDGRFSKNTEAAVKSFQQEYDLPVTGIVDTMTADLLEKPMKTPAALAFKLLTDKDMSRGDVLTVTWDEVPHAESYHIDLYNTRGNLIDSFDGITCNKVSFVVNEAATYVVKGYAENRFFTGEETTLEQKIKVHNTFSVTFVDDDGTVLNRQRVAYGQSAATPASPRKTGHSFNGWDKPFTKITEATVVTATYVPKKFTITFCNAAGNVINTQLVCYGEAAQAPDMTSVEGFAGWDKDFSFVEESMTVTAVAILPTNYPYIELSDASAVREADCSGYTVSFTAKNVKDETKVVRAVVALKTGTEKFLTLTESSAFKINARTSTSTYAKDVSVFVPYPYTATVAEVFVIENYEKPVPVSKTLKITNISTSNNYTDFLPSAPATHFGEVDSRIEYRYKTKSYKQSGASTMSGWTQYNRTVSRGKDGGWSGWTTNRIEEIYKEGFKVREVETRPQTYVTGVRARYWMTHWWSYEYYNYQGKKNYADWCRHYWNYYHAEEKPGNGVHYGALTFTLNQWDNMKHVQPGGSTTNYRYSGGYNFGNEAGRCYSQANDGCIWYKYGETTETVTQYRYRDYDLIYTYYYYRWSDWSGWSTKQVTATSDVQVENRTTKRYLVNDPYVDDTGKKRTITGIVDKTLAGKQATLFIYKAGDASDYSNEYIGQCVINKDGQYSFTFKMREEPSIETGDFTVTLGVEGSNTVIFLDKILAPLPTYTVRFCDDDGTVLSTQMVTKGDSAKLPDTNPSKVGYTFAGWNYSTAAIFQDTDIRALYVENEYTVTFIDWTNKLFEMHTGLHYGDPVVVPDLNYNIDGVVPVRWEGVVDGMTVTENMVITAKYDQKKLTVKFYDYDKNVICTQVVDYGDSVEPPVLDTDDEYIFLSWDQVRFDDIVLDMDVYPVYCFSRTCATPNANIESGVYDGTQTVSLTCSTENSVIYYYINGSDAQVYTQPITISETSALAYYAVSLGYNNSEVGESRFVINIAGDEQNWQYPVTVYDDDSVIMSALVPAGSTAESLVEDLDKTGYNVEGFYTDSGFTTVWNSAQPVNSATAIYVRFAPRQYLVTFRRENGTVLSTQSVDYLGAAVPPENLSLGQNERFIKWDSDAYLCVTGNTEVTAIIKDADDVAQVSLSKTSLTTIVGMSFNLEATVTPDSYADKTVVWSSDNKEIVTVNSEGRVTAVGVGSAVVTATLLADEVFSAHCVITVRPNKAECICLKDGSGLTVSRGYLAGVIPADNTVEEILSEIDSDSVSIFSPAGLKLADRDRVPSGSIIRLIDNHGNVLDALTVLVAGDVYADGSVNNKDAAMLLRKTVGKETFSDVQLLSADVNADGFITVMDVAMVLRYIKGMDTPLTKQH